MAGLWSPLVCSSSCQLARYPCRRAAGPCTARTAACEPPTSPAETPSPQKGCPATNNATQLYHHVLSHNMVRAVQSREKTVRMLSYLFLYLLGGVVSCIKQGLACFIGDSEAVLMGINLPLKSREEEKTFREIPFSLLTRNKHFIQYLKKTCVIGYTLCSWWRSSRASAPATSLASSSALMRAFISVTQLVRSLKSAVKRCSLPKIVRRQPKVRRVLWRVALKRILLILWRIVAKLRTVFYR